jgi:hypothetical protein
LNFDAEPEGKTPAELAVVLGRWTVVADAAAPSPPHVLAQTERFPVGLHFPRCLVSGLALEDLRAQVKFKPLAGDNDQAGGIIFRAQDAETYYVFRANLLDDLALFKSVEGTRRALGRFQARSEEWQLLRVEARGPEIRCYWNDRLVIEVRDASFASGQIGLWTIADSVSAFDDFEIEQL